MTEPEWRDWQGDPADLLNEVADEEGRASTRKLRLFTAACCRSVCHLLSDELFRLAIDAVEQMADGGVTAEALDRIRRSAEEHERAAGKEAKAQFLASDLGDLVATITEEPFHFAYQAQDASDCLAGLVARSVIPCQDWGTAAGDVAFERGLEEQNLRHCHLVRDIFGNPFRRTSADAGWQTPSVVSLAQAAYDDRILPPGELDPQRLSILSDALEDVGCCDGAILSHLRGPGPHTRGCWVVDWLLGKH